MPPASRGSQPLPVSPQDLTLALLQTPATLQASFGHPIAVPWGVLLGFHPHVFVVPPVFFTPSVCPFLPSPVCFPPLSICSFPSLVLSVYSHGLVLVSSFCLPLPSSMLLRLCSGFFHLHLCLPVGCSVLPVMSPRWCVLVLFLIDVHFAVVLHFVTNPEVVLTFVFVLLIASA